MEKVLSFTPKKSVNERLKEEMQSREEALKAVITNEGINRQRIDAIEKGLIVLSEVMSRGFFGRAKWLILGK